MIYENFSEKQILDGFKRNNHLGQSITLRPILKRVRCTQDYSDEQNRLIYQNKQEYVLWIVEYSDILLGITRWFTAKPQIIEENSPEFTVPRRTFHMVPVETFLHAKEAPKATSIKFDMPAETKYQLFVDVNDGMQKLIVPWSLEKMKVQAAAADKFGGCAADYRISGRMISNSAERHIVWLLHRKLGRKQYQDVFFDVLNQDFISWNMYADDASMAPISSGQAMIHIGTNTIKADKYRMYYKLGK